MHSAEPSAGSVRPRLIAIAHATSPELANWLAEAVTTILEGGSPSSPPGSAHLVERGSFSVYGDGLSVVAWGYSTPRQKQRIGVEVARCFGPDAAAELAERLNAVLEMS